LIDEDRNGGTAAKSAFSRTVRSCSIISAVRIATNTVGAATGRDPPRFEHAYEVGAEALAEIKKDNRLRTIPVVVLSTFSGSLED
jgi:hypothetical protein